MKPGREVAAICDWIPPAPPREGIQLGPPVDRDIIEADLVTRDLRGQRARINETHTSKPRQKTRPAWSSTQPSRRVGSMYRPCHLRSDP